MAQTAPRIVIVTFGGKVPLDSQLVISGSGGGNQGTYLGGLGPTTVEISGHEVSIEGPHVILRNVVFSRGDNLVSTYGDNTRYRSVNIGVNLADTIAIDHCVFRWSDNCNLYIQQGAGQISITNSAFWEAFRFLYDYEWQHSTLLTNHSTASGDILIKRCVFAYGGARGPRIASSGSDAVYESFNYAGGMVGGHAMSVWKNDAGNELDLISNKLASSASESNTGVFRVESGTLDNDIYFGTGVYANSWADSAYEGGLDKGSVDSPVPLTDDLWPVDEFYQTAHVEDWLLHPTLGVGTFPIHPADQAVRDSIIARGHLTPDVVVANDTAYGLTGTIGSRTTNTLVPSADPRFDSGSSLNDGWALKILSGSAAGRVRSLASYDAGTTTFTIQGTWGSPAPGIGESWQIVSVGFRGTAYGQQTSSDTTHWDYDPDSDGIPSEFEFHIGSNPSLSDAAKLIMYRGVLMTAAECAVDVQVTNTTPTAIQKFEDFGGFSGF
jgi:hypothetical protein